VKVVIIGKGRVGRALGAAFSRNAIGCRIYPYRGTLPNRLPNADLLLLCCRDGQLSELVRRLEGTLFPPSLVVAHVSGGMGPDVLVKLKPKCSGTAQLHPYCSILSSGHPRAFRDVPFLVRGDRAAIAPIRRLLKVLGAKAVVLSRLDETRYHLSAALLANGTLALLSEASRLLEASGIPKRSSKYFVQSLLGSVLHNTIKHGINEALTGPVRRGDTTTLKRHFAVLGAEEATLLPLYRELVLAQLRVVVELGEGDVVTNRKIAALARGR